MPIDVHCPSCGQKLKVPDSLVGRKVRCQKCNTAFEAVEELDMEVVDEPPEADVEIVEGPPKGGRNRPTSSRISVEKEEEIEDEEREHRRPRRRKRKRRTSAAAQVQIPALLMQITGYLGAGLSVILLIYRVVMVGTVMSQTSGAPGGSAYAAGAGVGLVVGVIVQILVTVAWCSVVIRGGQSMAQLHNYNNAIAGCIVAMLPCTCGCLMGLPIGIWSLVVLTQKDVKSAFT
jgi:hypothetical protein